MGLREAATAPHLHHSNLEERVAQLTKVLGDAPTTPQGRTRVTVALSPRRLRLCDELIGPV